MVAVIDREQRVSESGLKILAPYEVDPELCLYSPQDNVDALTNPKVAAWLHFVLHTYEPPPTDARRVLLFLPCTRTKPYVASIEHQRINARLLAEGFDPVDAGHVLPEATMRSLGSDDDRLFNLGPLRRGDIEIARVVMSEPLGFVPYEYTVDFCGSQAPSVSYDDPGLFENRGNAVSPWRPDSTAEQVSPTRWRWGTNEKRSYVKMHNAMSCTVACVLRRLQDRYDHTIAWVAPGLTHRSFCLARDERRDHGVAAAKRIEGTSVPLLGANDHLEQPRRIQVLPTPAECDRARERLRDRLGASTSAANAVFARGGGGATPLALPELLDSLMERLDTLS